MKSYFSGVLAAVAMSFAVSGTVRAQDQSVADVFRGKNISIYIGTGAGGGYDTYARVLARYFGNHVPGKPGMIAQNVPGAGGLKQLNMLYNTAPKDGTAIGIVIASGALEPLFGNKNASFDTTKFNWLGNMMNDSVACGVWHTSGVSKFSDLFKKEVTFGATSTSGYLYIHPLVTQKLTGAKIKIINGYQGSKDINMAMVRGEVHAACALFASSVRAEYSDDVKAGNLRFILQFGRERDPYFGDTPSIYELLKTDEDKALADLIFRPVALTRTIVAPPGLPEKTTAALRKAFNDTMVDPEFLAFAKKSNIEIKPSTGEEVAAEFASYQKVPKELIEKAKNVMAGK